MLVIFYFYSIFNHLGKCSWNEEFCWPGTNYEYSNWQCRCAEGFSSHYTQSEKLKCKPRKLPTILDCRTKFYIPNGKQRQAGSKTVSTACEHLQDVYGNFKPTHIEFKMASEFTIDVSSYSSIRPQHITMEKFGISDTTLNVEKKYVSGRIWIFQKLLLLMTCLFTRSVYLPFNYIFVLWHELYYM